MLDARRPVARRDRPRAGRVGGRDAPARCAAGGASIGRSAARRSEAEVAGGAPARAGAVPVIVLARRQLDDVDAVTSVVRRAFGVAARRRAPRRACSRAPCSPGASAGGCSGCATRRSASPRSARSPSSSRSAEATRSATSAARSGSCSGGCASRSRRGASFVATASHELRTPVTSLQLMLDLLISDLEAEPPAVGGALRQAPRRGRPGGAAVAAGRRAARSQPDRCRRTGAPRAGGAGRGAALGRGRAGGAARPGAARGRLDACGDAVGDAAIPITSRASCGSCSTTRCATPRRPPGCAAR